MPSCRPRCSTSSGGALILSEAPTDWRVGAAVIAFWALAAMLVGRWKLIALTGA
jgi:hypothetical protein